MYLYMQICPVFVLIFPSHFQHDHKVAGNLQLNYLY